MHSNAFMSSNYLHYRLRLATTTVLVSLWLYFASSHHLIGDMKRSHSITHVLVEIILPNLPCDLLLRGLDPKRSIAICDLRFGSVKACYELETNVRYLPNSSCVALVVRTLDCRFCILFVFSPSLSLSLPLSFFDSCMHMRIACAGCQEGDHLRTSQGLGTDLCHGCEPYKVLLQRHCGVKCLLHNELSRAFDQGGTRVNMVMRSHAT